MCRMTEEVHSIEDLLDDLLDRVALAQSPSPLLVHPPSRLDDRFHQSLDVLHRSLSQLLDVELNLVVQQGSLTQPTHLRQSRSIKHHADLRKRLQWLEERQRLSKELAPPSCTPLLAPKNNSLDALWFDQRRRMDEQTRRALNDGREEEEDDGEEREGCARCRIYRRKKSEERRKTLSSGKWMDLDEFISSLAKIADRLGHSHSTLFDNEEETREVLHRTSTTTSLQTNIPHRRCQSQTAKTTG